MRLERGRQAELGLPDYSLPAKTNGKSQKAAELGWAPRCDLHFHKDPWLRGRGSKGEVGQGGPRWPLPQSR